MSCVLSALWKTSKTRAQQLLDLGGTDVRLLAEKILDVMPIGGEPRLGGEPGLDLSLAKGEELGLEEGDRGHVLAE